MVRRLAQVSLQFDRERIYRESRPQRSLDIGGRAKMRLGETRQGFRKHACLKKMHSRTCASTRGALCDAKQRLSSNSGIPPAGLFRRMSTGFDFDGQSLHQSLLGKRLKNKRDPLFRRQDWHPHNTVAQGPVIASEPLVDKTSTNVIFGPHAILLNRESVEHKHGGITMAEAFC